MIKPHTILLLCLTMCHFQLLGQEDSIREYLTGNWKGARDSLEENGLSFEPRLTVFNQNFVSGEGENEYAVNGLAQMEIKFNGRQIGLKRWTLITKFDYSFGEALAHTGNVVIPSNTAVTFPGFEEKERFDISNVALIYSWKPENRIVVGKINTIDLVEENKFSGGAGIDAFWSLGICAPVTGITPPYILGALANITNERFGWQFMVYDAASVVRKTGFEEPYKKGVVLSASPTLKTKIGGLKGNHTITLAYSTQNGTDLYELGDLFLPTDTLLADKKDRYYASYSFNQTLQEYAEEGSWGVFGQVAVSDGNPNPIDFSLILGLGGNSFFKNRRQDRWGIAFYNYSLSSIVDFEANMAGIDLRDEWGIETFYQFWLTPWFSIGANAQVIQPVVRNSETAVFLGLRSSIKF